MKRTVIRRAACAVAGMWMAAMVGTVAAQQIGVEAFAGHARISDIALSPTGDEVALAVPSEDGSETRLEIITLGEGENRAFRFGKRMHVTDIYWTADDRLVVSKADMEPLKARPYSQGELFTTDLLGEDQEMLFGYVPSRGTMRGRRRDQGYAEISQVLDSQPGIALVSFRCWDCGEDPDTALFRVDTRTGERNEIARFPDYADFLADRNGVPRVAVGSDGNDRPWTQYRPTADADWQPLPGSLAGYSLEPLHFAPDNNTLYALVSDDMEPKQLYRIDLAAGTRTRLAGRDDMAVAGVLWEGRQGKPFGVSFDAGKPTIVYFDEISEWAALHAGLMKLFPGELIGIVDVSRDGRTVLFATWSGRHPGAYYVFERDDDQIRLVAETHPDIDPEKMAPVRPVSFASRDGRTLFGFYTSAKAGPRPMVVIPHGGPFGVHDRWGYDPDVQFLASRGYAVLQVNFRGSGGRGQKFIESGYREWGGAIQDDIADGVRWAIGQKLADPERICIFGASFGGYAALMNPIRYPDLYQCAIGYVGVYDLELMFSEGDIPDTRAGRRYLERVLGTDPAVLAANSPARQVEEIDVPVFLAQGRIDRRVPMDQFDALVEAFEDHDREIKTLVVPGEGHGFYKPENRERLYREMEAFLGAHIGAAVP